MILGNDCSRYQGDINFNKMRQAGCQFVYLRVGVGWNIDIRIAEYKKQVKDVGIPWGLYWIPWPTSFSQGLLDNYFEMIGTVNSELDCGDLPLALDVETAGLGLGIFKMWAEQVIERTGRKPMFYTRASHFDKYENIKDIKGWLGENTDLWVAHYTYDPNNKPALPKDSWDTYKIHQYSADENSLGAHYGVSSKAIDMNYFNGDAFDFAQFTKAGEIQPDPEPEPTPEPGLGKVMVRWNMPSDRLRFRNRPELYEGRTLLLGKGDELSLLSPDKQKGDIEYWHVKIDGYEGYISAGKIWTERI